MMVSERDSNRRKKSTVGSKHQEPESAGGNEVPNMLDTVSKKNPTILDRLKKRLHVIYFIRDCNIDHVQNQIHNSSPPFPTLKYLIV